MWCLARHLVPDELKSKFEVVLLLLEIMDIVFALKISVEMVLQLNELVSEYNFLSSANVEIGPRKLPCGTPASIGCRDECSSYI